MKRPLPKTVLAVLAGGAALAVTGIVTQTSAHETHTAPKSGLRCSIVTHDLGDAVEISGKVSADRPVAGAYALSIRQSNSAGQAMIDQSGDFTVDAGRTVTLGQAILGGTPSGYHAELELTVEGQRLRCLGADSEIDL